MSMSQSTDMAPDGPANVIETEYSLGQDNVQPKLGPFNLDVHNPVFLISELSILLLGFALVKGLLSEPRTRTE